MKLFWYFVIILGGPLAAYRAYHKLGMAHFEEWRKGLHVESRRYKWDGPIDRRQAIADTGVPRWLRWPAYRELWYRQPRTNTRRGKSPDYTLTLHVDVRRPGGLLAKDNWEPV